MLDLYACDKAIPQSKTEFESYQKLRKFQRHEKYPDPHLRNFIEKTLFFNFSNEQYLNFTVNYMDHIKKLKEEVREGISTLYDARSKIYKAIMTSDLLRTQGCLQTIRKEQLLNMAGRCTHSHARITYDQIFNIKREDISVKKIMEIPNPKFFAKASIFNPHGDSKEFPSELTELYSTTSFKCMG